MMLIALLSLLVIALCGLIGGISYLALYPDESSLDFDTLFSDTNEEVAAAPAVLTDSQALPTVAATAEPVISPTPFPTTTPQPTLPPTLVPSPTAEPLLSAELLPSQLIQIPHTDDMSDSLTALLNEPYPTHNYYEEYIRLSRDKPFGRTVQPSFDSTIGAELPIIVDEVDITLELGAITDDAYFWYDTRLPYSPLMFQPITSKFDQIIYPTLLDHFGQEWRPGIDNDERFHVVHLAQIGDNQDLGFFDSSDMYPKQIFEWSNEIDAVYLNMAELSLGEDYYYATLAHEVQHLIQWAQDANETTWLDEGLAQLAEYILDYDTFDVVDYTDETDFQFNTWDNNDDVVYKHYGAAALFAVYFYEQLGPEAAFDLSQNPRNGLAAVQEVLSQYRPDLTLEQFLSDWYVANYTDNSLDLSQYTYQYDFPRVVPDEVIRNLPHEESFVMAQLGVRYLQLVEPSDYTISFAGDTVVELVPPPPTGSHVWLVPEQNGVAATLRRAVDLTAVTEANLVFDTWYQLEEEYDLAYVLVSLDNGASWQTLAPEDGALGIYGIGLNGRSNTREGNKHGWVRERISLDEYIGQEILISIELFTDGVVTENHFALTQLHIPEIDPEPTPDLWDGNGFAYIVPQLAQNWSLQLIHHNDGRVEPLTLDRYNQLDYTFALTGEATIIIAPTTPFTRYQPLYWLQITKAGSE